MGCGVFLCVTLWACRCGMLLWVGLYYVGQTRSFLVIGFNGELTAF